MSSPAQARRDILDKLASGDLAGAATAARQLAEAHPGHPDARYAQGMVALVQGNHAAAVDALTHALAAAPDDAVAACNLGIARLRAGDARGAREVLQQALRLKNDYETARYNLACAHIALDEAEPAIALLRELLRGKPHQAQWQLALGDAHHTRGDWARAIAAYEHALALDDSLAIAHQNLAPLLAYRGRHGEAEAHGRRAVELNPRSALAHLHLGDALAAQERFADAMDAYADAHDLDPDCVPLLVSIARNWAGQGNQAEAASWFDRVRQRDPDNLDAIAGLAEAALENDNTDAALTLLQQHATTGEQHPRFLQTLAEAWWEEGDADAALATLEKLRLLLPQRAATWARIGQIRSSSGDVDAARAAYRIALEHNPRCVPAIAGLASTERGKLDPALADRARELLADARGTTSTRASLHFALAYFHEGRKEFAEAAAQMRAGNEAQWEGRSARGWTYSTDAWARLVDEHIATFTPEFFARHRGIGNPDVRPVFIVGMPRSGTTLTEQILARHPRALGIGERGFAGRSLQAWQRRSGRPALREAMAAVSADGLAPIAADYLATLHKLVEKSGKQGVTRIIDKMPDNYSQLGWIALLFPNARIIHCRRDVRDVAMSCYQTQFGAIRWACHPEHLVERIRQYQRIMAHWRQVLPSPVFESDYELLTADQETQSRKLVEWIGLDWDPQCLSFYDSDRLVRTASITQVRQPIYRSSVQKWKAYEPYLPDLLLPLESLNHAPLPEA